MTTQTKKRGWIFIFLFLILLLGGAIVYSYQLWQEFNASQQKISAKISTLQTELKGLHSQTHDIQRLDKDLTRLTYKIETQPEHDDDWKIAEINYLLTIALHRLQLQHDHKGALAALKAADERLQHLNKPTLFQVRTQLLKDIQHLTELEQPDIARLAMRLATIPDLPLLQGTHQNHKPEKQINEQSWQNRILDNLKQIVVIRYNSNVESGFLSPGQRSLVMQILQLKLENARFFLLRRDSPNFSASIQTVQDWIKHYYDQNDKQVNALQKDLKNMQNIVLNPTLPDISGSLSLLITAQTEKNTQ